MSVFFLSLLVDVNVSACCGEILTEFPFSCNSRLRGGRRAIGQLRYGRRRHVNEWGQDLVREEDILRRIKGVVTRRQQLLPESVFSFIHIPQLQ